MAVVLIFLCRLFKMGICERENSDTGVHTNIAVTKVFMLLGGQLIRFKGMQIADVAAKPLMSSLFYSTQLHSC